MKKVIFLMSSMLFMLSSCTSKKTTTDHPGMSTSYDEAVLEWQNQKFSMFIHFGLYSIPAGIWKGEKITGYSEQIKGHAKIPTDEYRKLAAEFIPTLWDPDSIALLATEAGMKSIVITAKHHDGFCLFDSRYTAFDIVDATPYQKDIIKGLAEACQRHGLKFGVYFSTIDWDYPGALRFTSTYNSDSIPPDHHQYNLNQVEELLTNYGEISEVWFDMGAPTYEQSKEMAELVKRIQPNCLVSGRIWNDQGDFMVMGDNYTPDFKLGVPWQTPASMFPETWSYRSWQERTDIKEKVREKIHNLLNIVSSGGKYLLNIGPKGDGSVVSYERQVLLEMGKWLQVNGEAVYNTSPSPIDRPEWGFITEKPGKLYLHVIDNQGEDHLLLKGVNIKFRNAYLLSDKTIVLNAEQADNQLKVALPDDILENELAIVIVVEYDEDIKYIPTTIVDMSGQEEVILNEANAIKYHSYSGHDYYSSKPTVIRMEWHVTSDVKEDYNIFLYYDPETATDTLQILVNEDKYIIPVDKSKPKKTTDEPIEFHLNQEKINHIILSFENQDNPHRGMNAEEVNIVIK